MQARTKEGQIQHKEKCFPPTMRTPAINCKHIKTGVRPLPTCNILVHRQKQCLPFHERTHTSAPKKTSTKSSTMMAGGNFHIIFHPKLLVHRACSRQEHRENYGQNNACCASILPQLNPVPFTGRRRNHLSPQDVLDYYKCCKTKASK